MSNVLSVSLNWVMLIVTQSFRGKMWVMTNFRCSFEILAPSFPEFSAGKYVKVATVYLEVHLEHK
jgi:hypothetical protein